MVRSQGKLGRFNIVRGKFEGAKGQGRGECRRGRRGIAGRRGRLASELQGVGQRLIKLFLDLSVFDFNFICILIIWTNMHIIYIRNIMNNSGSSEPW